MRSKFDKLQTRTWLNYIAGCIPRILSVFGMLLLTGVFAKLNLFAGEGAPVSMQVVAHLQYHEVDYAPLAWEVGVQAGTKFAKEPPFSGTGVSRGILRLGADTNLFLPFAWDGRAHRLYLDLNRNRDLTDDPAGVFTSTGNDLQLFHSIRLEFPAKDGPYQVLLDAHVFGSAAATRVFFYVRSLWEGSVVLDGKKWYVALIDKPDGRLDPTESMGEIGDRMVLRHWDQRDQPSIWWHASLPRMHDLSHVKLVTFPYRYAGNAEVFDAFNFPAKLFLQGQAYQLGWQIEKRDGPVDLALSFQPLPVTLAKLRVRGEAVRRIVLDSVGASNGFTAVLDAPDGEVSVPEGVYRRQLVWLQREGQTNVAIGINTNRLTISETNLAVLDAGGPLNSRVEIGNSGNGTVSLRYELANEAGLKFHLAFQREKDPPRLVIRQAEKEVGKGQFEFG
jgi:hypothetical protein